MTTSEIKACAFNKQRGFTLLEVMVALALGLLLTVGILSLFQSTSQTNRLQNGLARLQENGRFAVSRIETDLRMLGAQACSNFSGNASLNTGYTPVWTSRAMKSYVGSLTLPDREAPLTNTAAFDIDPSEFVKGHECSAGCTLPELGTYSSEGLEAGARVPGSDVLTIRYQSGSGWPLAVGTCSRSGAPVAATDSILQGDVFSLVEQDGNDPFPTDTPSALFFYGCTGSYVLPISGGTMSALTVGAILPSAPAALCQGNPTTDVRVYDISNFVTVTYFLVFRENDDPDAGGRLVPTLVRRLNGGPAQDLVQGVDQLEFVYGVLDADGATRYMTAAQVDAAGTSDCTPASEGMNNAAGCMWRNVRNVEARLLVNSTNELFGIDAISRSFRFNGETTDVAADGSTELPSGQTAGSMLRREFIAQTMIRNRNP